MAERVAIRTRVMGCDRTPRLTDRPADLMWMVLLGAVAKLASAHVEAAGQGRPGPAGNCSFHNVVKCGTNCYPRSVHHHCRTMSDHSSFRATRRAIGALSKARQRVSVELVSPLGANNQLTRSAETPHQRRGLVQRAHKTRAKKGDIDS